MGIIVVRPILVLPALLVALTGFAGAQESEAAKAEVLKVSARFDEARAAKDRATLERILADGLSWTARGDRLNKAQVIADILTDNLHFKSFAHDSLVAKAFGNTVVVTGHSTS